MLPKPLGQLVNFHREQPVGAILGLAVVGIISVFASEAALMMSIDNYMRVPVSLMNTSGALFVLWWLLCGATMLSSLKVSTSRVTLVAAVWYLESMIQLGITPNVLHSTIVPMLFMAALALMGYVIAAYRLQGKIAGIRQERKMAAFVAQKVSVTAAPAEEEMRDLLPTRK